VSGPAHWDAESVGELLLSVVAERTGYPVEILNVDMELDTDLGVDSIKKVEILSAVRERVGDLPSGELSALAGLRTLRAIAERVSGPATPTGGPPASAPAAGTVPRSSRGRDPEPGGEAVPGAGVDLSRQVMRAVEAPRSGLAMLGLTGHPLVVTDDGQGVAPLVVERLAGHGIQAEVVAEVPPGATGVILLDGLRPVASIDEALAIGRTVFRAARTVAAQMANPRMAGTGGVFVTVQDTGGDFGIASAPADPVRAWLGGIVGLTRTVAREWPGAAVKAIDCAGTGRGPGAVAGEIVTELLRGGGAAEVGLPAGGTRVVAVLNA
jgi:acyl carrier protein